MGMALTEWEPAAAVPARAPLRTVTTRCAEQAHHHARPRLMRLTNAWLYRLAEGAYAVVPTNWPAALNGPGPSTLLPLGSPPNSDHDTTQRRPR
jgi:hypothetical protein